MRKITILLALIIFSAGTFAQIKRIESTNRIPIGFTPLTLDNKIISEQQLNKAAFDSALQSWNSADPFTLNNGAFGHNKLGDFAWAEKYYISKPGKLIEGIAVFFGERVTSNDSAYFIVFDNNKQVKGVSKGVRYKDMKLNNPQSGSIYTHFTFSTPVDVQDSFYMGIEFTQYDKSSLKDSVYLYSTKNGFRKNNYYIQNFFLTTVNGENFWGDISDTIYGYGVKENLLIGGFVDFCNLTVNASADVTINKGDSTILTQTNSGGTGNVTIGWSTVQAPTSAQLTISQSVKVIPTKTTKYYVLAVTTDGCVAQDSVLVTVKNANGISSINSIDNL
ncbi:MAG: hypothetical protein Q8880_08715, partial [Bacteroidota bacterium]|nr:hypothetical protein [Bacteroidota bacterium]